VSTLPPLLPVIAAIISTVALLVDVRQRRIPNWLTGSGLLLGFGVHAVTGELADGLSGAVSGGLVSLTGAAIGLGMLVPFYMLKAMGAGDVKLLAALGAILGPQALVSVAVYGALVGGVQSLLVLAAQGRLAPVLHHVLVTGVVPARSGAKAPYAVALAAGVYLALILPPVLAA
jgi:prepilin peptidase CpaA